MTTYRNRNVPTNSPAMAMKWFRTPFGSLLKKEDGRGGGILSDAEAVCEIPVPFLFCRPKSPGRNPDFALMLSISGGSCGQTQFPEPKVARLAAGRASCNVFNRGRSQKTKYDNCYDSNMTITGNVRKMARLDELVQWKSKERVKSKSQRRRGSSRMTSGSFCRGEGGGFRTTKVDDTAVQAS
jgi:hypothetical protein